MAQTVFDKIQFGRQSALATAVAATTVYPGRATSFDLDRGYEAPDEDWGRLSDEQPGRGLFGLRAAGGQISSQVRFEDVMHLLEMHLAGSITPTGVGPYTWPYTSDETSLTPKPYTIEMGSETAQDQWRLTGCLATDVALGFDALTAPGNAPWTAEATVIAINREINALTAALSAPATLETAEGHLTTLSEGTTATAFGSLAELTASLVNFKLTSRVPYKFLAYGSTGDTAVDRGVEAKAGITFEAGIKVGATSKTNIHDIYNTSGSTVQERRWRIRAAGSGTKTLTVDARVRFRTVGRADRDGEAIYGIEGSMVYDATLGGRVQIAVVNSVSVLP